VLQIAEHEILVKIFNGLKIYLDTRDIGLVPHLALDKIWEPEITRAWLSLVGPADTVFDIGANFGYFGLLAAQRTDKKAATIRLFEPNPRLIPYIQKTFSLNWYNEQTVIENLAVSNKKQDVTLNVLRDYIASSSVHSIEKLSSYLEGKMKLEVEETVSIPAVTIDDYCKEHKIQDIDLIKMDIEGYEDAAYEGMRQIVKKSQNLTLFIEFTKEGYKDPEGFYRQLLEDFGNMYVINTDGSLSKPQTTDYATIIGTSSDWVMPVFSKRNDLASS
jgi:FkbM family methyltransferase